MKLFWLMIMGLVFFSAPACAGQWNLVQKEYDGKIISLIHDLTKRQCEYLKARSEGGPATPAEELEVKKWYDEDNAAQEKFRKEHNCKDSFVYTAPGPRHTGYVNKDGTCIWSTGQGPFNSGSGMMSNYHSAECFK